MLHFRETLEKTMKKNAISIRTLMFGMVFLISSLMLGLMFMMWHMSREVAGDLETFSNFEQITFMVNDIRYHTVQTQQFLTDASLTHELDGIDKAREHADAGKILFMRLSEIEPRSQTRLQLLSKDLENMRKIGEEMVEAYTKQGVSAGNLLMKRPIIGFDDRANKILGEVEDLVEDLKREMRQQGHALAAGGKKLVTKTANFQIVIFLLVLISCLLALLVISRRVKGLFNTLDISFSRIADGDLTLRLDTSMGSEQGKIASSINHFVEQLIVTLHKFLEITEDVSTSIAEVYVHANDTADGVSKQSEQIEQMATAVTETSNTIHHLASNAEGASASAREVAVLVQRGSDSIRTAIEGMHEVKSKSEASALVLDSLGQRSNEISKIAEVIRDIAAQTNLLALNAAIEAARAGEQGRGFAVVADEVRQLAVKTAQATGKITEMIRAVQEETCRSVASMKEVAEGVTQGVYLIHKTGESLGQIMQRSEDVAHNMMEIAAAVEEQSVTTQQISRNIEEISIVARRIAGRAQKNTRVAEVLATEIVEELEATTRHYKLENTSAQMQGEELKELLKSVPPLFVWEDGLAIGI